MPSIYDFKEKEINGQPLDLNNYRNKVLLLVNTASKCGLAPKQLDALEKLYKKYHQDGLEIIGLPSNQFKNELKTDQEAQAYCKRHFGVSFPLTERITVNGEKEDPLFTYLKKAAGHGRIKWNYTKFLIGRDGKIIHRYAPITNPEKMTPAIEQALQA